MLDHTSLTLWFSKDESESPYLSRSLFVDPKHSNIAACRFETDEKASSSSLKLRNALACLFVSAITKGDFSVSLSGGSGSLATSLDYACRTNAGWLLKMLGRTETGRPRSEQLIGRRTLGSGEAIEVYLKPTELIPEHIRVICDRELVHSVRQLEELAAKLYRTEPGAGVLASTDSSVTCKNPVTSFAVLPEKQNTPSAASELKPNPLQDSLSYNTLFSLFERELHSMLWQTNIFSTNGKRRLLHSLRDEPAFLGNCKSPLAATSDIDMKLSASAQLGCQSPNVRSHLLNTARPIRIAVPADLVGSVAVLRYLQEVKKFPVEVDFNFSHSPEIADTVFAERFLCPPDGIILSAPAASRVISARNRTDYAPLMFTPGLSRRVVAPIGDRAGDRELARGCFLCLSESQSVSGSYLDALGKSGAISNTTIAVMNSEPHESTEALSSGDPLLRAIFVFPHYDLNTIFNNCQIVDTAEQLPTISQSILFLSKQLMNDSVSAELLNVAIRGAWLELRQSPEARRAAIELLLGDPEYLRLIERFCGLHQLNVRCLEETPTSSSYVELSSYRNCKRSSLHSGSNRLGDASQKNLASARSRF